MLRVLFLGIYLDFYYCLERVLLPKLGFHFDRDAVSHALMQTSLVPPGHPLECRDFYLDNIIPPANMDQLTSCEGPFTFSEKALSYQSNSSGRSGNAALDTSLVVDNADILRPVVTMVNQP